ncbi:hypothetical protein BJ170DRAFT_200207 [Xylariales sp. AK1849]|nr:hypothetical protein BJ170DRAFT_200207 [Xylariales sp. AK1849]
MADPPTPLLWTLILVVTALFLALVVVAQVVASHSTAYMAAPREITTFVDAVDFSIQENESYDRDVARVQRLEDKMRLGRLLREIQKGGDDLREHLNTLLVTEEGTALRTSTRILWRGHRKELEERVRRLDLLRTRFLVVYMGIVATSLSQRDKQVEKTAPKARDPEKAAVAHRQEAPRPGFPRNITDSIKKKPPLRRLTMQAVGHSEKVEPPHRMGWMGVVHELQRSPLMHRRHASIENAMRSEDTLRSPTLSPLGSPTPMSKVPSPFNLKSTRED